MPVSQENCAQFEAVSGKKRKQELRILPWIKHKRIFTIPEDYAVCLIRTDRDYLV
jgi:hypothetical protein